MPSNLSQQIKIKQNEMNSFRRQRNQLLIRMECAKDYPTQNSKGTPLITYQQRYISMKLSMLLNIIIIFVINLIKSFINCCKLE